MLAIRINSLLTFTHQVYHNQLYHSIAQLQKIREIYKKTNKLYARTSF
jgi:hypothetical protein